MTYAILLSILLLLLIVTVFIIRAWYFILPSLISGGALYVPSTEQNVRRMIELAHIQPTDRIIDLGSGDGRMVIAAMKAGGAEGTGYELQPSLVRLARYNARAAGLEAKTHFFWKSMWRADVHQADVVFIYQISYAMKKLSGKLRAELPKGSRVVSNGFAFPDWKIEKQVENIYLYRS
jgi:ribosomal protein L11 methylase PrmA